MSRLRFWIILLAVCCLSWGAVSLAQGESLGRTIDNLNVRTGPETTSEVLTQIAGGTRVVIEGRNDIGNWIMIHATDNSFRGWVASRYVAFDDNVVLAALPVITERLHGTAPPPAAEESAPPPQPLEASSGRTISTLNVRVGPDTSHEATSKIPARTPVVIEGRNSVGDWIFIHSLDQTIRGWVAARYVAFNDDVSLATMPVITQVIGQQDLGFEIPNIQLPTEDPPTMEARLRTIPLLHNFVNDQILEIYRRGKRLGNRPNVFMKVGDSVTATQPFMLGFGQGNYDLGGYGYLQEAINFFSVAPRAGYANSFVNNSIAAQSGFTSSAVFDGLWVNPAICTEAPLYCEYNYIKPAAAIILFGPVDMQISGAYEFQASMYRLAGELVTRGVIPVYTTFANHPQIRGEDGLLFNTIILNVARDYNVPVINLWLATQNLPDYGIKLDDPVHLTQGDTYYHFNGEETLYGVTLRNLLTLQALDELRKNVLTK